MIANAVCNARTHACTHTYTSFVLHASHSFLSPTPQHFTGLMQVSCWNTEFSCEKKKHSQLGLRFSFAARLHTRASQLREQEVSEARRAITARSIKAWDLVCGKIPLRLELPHVWRGRLCPGHKSPHSICISLSKRRIWRAEAHVGRFPQFAYK